jgi:integrase
MNTQTEPNPGKATRKRKAETFPIEIKRGSAMVKIYKSEHRGEALFTITYMGPDDSRPGKLKRQKENFKGEKNGEGALTRARRAAGERADKLAIGDLQAVRMTGAERQLYVAACETLAPTKVPLNLAAQEYAQAFTILGGHYILDAARHYAKTMLAGLPDIMVQDAVSEYIEIKRRAKVSALHMKDLRLMLGRFSSAFHCLLHDVTADLLRDYLDGLKVGRVTERNNFAVIKGLFGYAKSRRWLTEEQETAADILKSQRSQEGESKRSRAKAKAETIKIYSPSEMGELLACAPERYLPHIILVGFCGLRHDEITEELLPEEAGGKKPRKWKRRPEARGQLRWEHINFNEGCIVVPAEISKTGQTRKIILEPNALEWLKPHAGQTGFIYPVSTQGERRKTVAAVNDARQKRGVESLFSWKQNALRHSFCSYYLEKTQNAGAVALAAGNSASVVMRHYAEIVSAKDASAWWSIRPAKATKVVQFAA